MAVELFDRNAYSVLGLAQEGSSAEVGSAFAKAQQQRRAKPQALGGARAELANVGTRLGLDALTILPPVPDRVLSALASTSSAPAPLADIDPVEALLLLPEIELSARQVELPRPELRADLAEEPILSLEVER